MNETDYNDLLYEKAQKEWSRQDLCAKLFAGSGRPEVSRQ